MAGGYRTDALTPPVEVTREPYINTDELASELLETVRG
jgi:hypothetical protein